MNRRVGPGSWGTRSGVTFYGGRRRRGPRPLLLTAIVAALAIIVGLLVIRACGGDDCAKEYCPSGRNVATPEGYERVSNIFEWTKENRDLQPGSDLSVSVPLNKTLEDGRNLGFFSYNSEARTWEPITAAVLDAGGKSVSARFTDSIPTTIAVLRRESAAGHVIAYLPPGAGGSGPAGQIHPEAATRATIVHTRAFTVLSDGALRGQPVSVQSLGFPAGSGVQHFPMVTVDGTDQGQKALISQVLGSATTRSAHVQQIVKTVEERTLPGIDIAYFDLAPELRTSFALFISELGTALHAIQRQLSVTVPSPIKTGDRIDEGAYDWTDIGKSADIVQLWVYRDQSTYRRDMPEILTHLVSRVPPSKLVLTVTPYATEKSDDGLRPLSITAAMVTATRLAASGTLATNSNVSVKAANIDQTDGRSGIVWNANTATVAFTYEAQGGRTVWIENVFSVGFKLELIPQFGLGGVAVEDASADQVNANIWPALVPFISTGQPVLLKPNPQDLVPKWEVSKGAIEGGAKGVVTWQTPAEPGTYEVKVIVSDGVARFENKATFSVIPRDRATPTPTPAR